MTKILGEIPQDIETIVLDIDATVYDSESPFLFERTKREYEWIAKKFGIEQSEAPQFINRQKNEILKSKGNQRRVSLSEVLFSLGVKSEEWNMARENNLPKPAKYLKFNPALQRAIAAISEKIQIIWNTNSSERIGRKILETVLGIFTEKFLVIGQKNELFKPSKEFVRSLIIPEILAKNGSLDKTISIGDRIYDDGYFPIQTGIKGAIIINGPKELVTVLNALLQNIKEGEK